MNVESWDRTDGAVVNVIAMSLLTPPKCLSRV